MSFGLRPRAIGSQSQPFHDAGPIAFEHDVRPLQERETECDGGRVLEIERQRAAPALGDLMRLRRRRVRAIDPQHVGAHVGEKHPAERAGTDAGEFHDTHTESLPLPIQQPCPAPRPSGRRNGHRG